MSIWAPAVWKFSHYDKQQEYRIKTAESRDAEVITMNRSYLSTTKLGNQPFIRCQFMVRVRRGELAGRLSIFNLGS